MRKMVQGIIQVMGGHDSGKTTFALECGAEPAKIAFFDDDIKGRGTINSLEDQGFKIGAYHDLAKLSEKKTELVFHDAVLEILKKIRPGQFDAIVWDTWTAFANTCHPFVMRHPAEFRSTWSPMGKIKGAQQWQEARRYEMMILNTLATLSPAVFIITHLKDFYIGDAKVPGKQVPASSGVLDKVPSLRLWLRQNPNGRPVPVGLVLKRMDKKIFVAGKGIRTVNVLPRKIVPIEGENSLWDSIERYWNDPVGDRKPTEDEVPDEYELSILDSTLTAEQTHTFKSMLENGMTGRVEDEEEKGVIVPEKRDVNMDTILLVKGMAEEGRRPPDIAKELEISLPDVLRAIRYKVVEDPHEDVDFQGVKNG